MLSIHSGMMVASLLIFAVETVVLCDWKAQVDQTDTNEIIFRTTMTFEEMLLVLKEVEPQQLLIYTAIYLAFYRGTMSIFVLAIVIAIQVMSTWSELGCYDRLRRRGIERKTHQ